MGAGCDSECTGLAVLWGYPVHTNIPVDLACREHCRGSGRGPHEASLAWHTGSGSAQQPLAQGESGRILQANREVQ